MSLLSAVTTLSFEALGKNVAVIVVLGLVLYGVYGAIYRLYLSPIAHVPGPWLARLTFWNEFYYDVVLGGRYTFKISDYHEKYGPIIRINPFEVHVKDSDFADELYVVASKRKSDKWPWAVRMFGQVDTSIFDTSDHDQHRVRRAPWNPYFSKQSVERLQPLLIQNLVNKLCNRLEEHRDAGKPVVMLHAYACLAADVISEYSFPEGYSFLDQREFDRKHYDAWMARTKMSHLLKHFGWLYPLLNSLPMWVTKMPSPETYIVLQQMLRLRHQTAQVFNANYQGKSHIKQWNSRPSLIEAFLDSNLPESDKTIDRIAGETQIAIVAGTLTVSHCLKHATFHILANPHIHERLMNDLEQAIPDTDAPPNLRQLESIEYLVAILYESLRNFHGVTQRLQRISPDQVIHYKDYALPPGTPISMTGVFTHDNPDIFLEPYEFRPERWLPLSTNGVRLQKYLMAFGKGSRQCVGMELGKAEVMTALATVFRRFGRKMSLVDTYREKDIDVMHDYFNPASSSQSNGLVVKFEK